MYYPTLHTHQITNDVEARLVRAALAALGKPAMTRPAAIAGTRRAIGKNRMVARIGAIKLADSED